MYCDSCQHSLLVAFSCKKRGVCPSCSAKRAVKFPVHIYSEILSSVAHRHIVFSVRKRLRPYFRYDRKLCGILFRAAWGSVASQVNNEQLTPGLILTIQTAGDALNWNLDFAKASSEQASYGDPAVALAKADSPTWANQRCVKRSCMQGHEWCVQR